MLVVDFMVILVLQVVIDPEELGVLFDSLVIWRDALFNVFEIRLELEHCKPHGFESDHHLGLCFQAALVLLLVEQWLP